MIAKDVKKCPRTKLFKPRGFWCKRCKFYNSKKWFANGKEIDTFCTYSMDEEEKKHIKGN